MFPARIVIQRKREEHVRHYTLNRKIGKNHIYLSFGNPLSDKSTSHFEQLTVIGKEVIKGLLDIDDSIIHISVDNSYDMSISIGRAFKWSDLEPKILVILKKMAFEPEEEIEVIPIKDKEEDDEG